jgi:hypothetical protein
VVAELLVVTEEIRRKIVLQAPSAEIQDVALAQGMQTMFRNGMQKVLRGVTSLEEVLAVCEDGDAQGAWRPLGKPPTHLDPPGRNLDSDRWEKTVDMIMNICL